MPTLILKLEILRKFLTKDNWNRVGLALDCFGGACEVDSEDAVQFCTSGALLKLFPDNAERKEIADALTWTANKIIKDNSFIDGGYPINYLYEYDYMSDYPQIVDLIDQAIELEKLSEKMDDIFTI